MTDAKKFNHLITQAVNAYKEVLDQPYNKSNTATYVCTTFGVSRNILQQRFRKQYGIGIRDYKLRQRMVQARQLLTLGKDVKEVAVQLHYSKARAFSSAFKRYYGLTPSEFCDQL